MKQLVAVGLGGMIGALLRVAIYTTVVDGIGLWIVNIIGSFLIGLAAIRLSHKSAELRLFISTGLLGSFTTFSAFSADWFYYLQSSIWLGLIFAGSMTIACVSAAAAGLWLGRKGVSSL
ncbi:fluoride efflux transporter FluC [Planococcus versutus]|uniref:Fluoride-specific ion channel FluC n=1 Tax=Planococcus versutus TaxID=1302659 RepID=A0A1B1RZW4_9BACL|nr:CrcB family protein [Planococcus versutus]ANU26466.1 camphor resistance protein CrcB [Planococcus versutus]